MVSGGSAGESSPAWLEAAGLKTLPPEARVSRVDKPVQFNSRGSVTGSRTPTHAVVSLLWTRAVTSANSVASAPNGYDVVILPRANEGETRSACRSRSPSNDRPGWVACDKSVLVTVAMRPSS